MVFLIKNFCFEADRKAVIPPINKPARPAARKKQEVVYCPEKLKNTSRNSQEFAKRMIMEGIMSLETIARLSGLDIKTVQLLATIVAWESDKGM